MARDERETTRESETIPEIDFGELAKRVVELENAHAKHAHTESNTQRLDPGAIQAGQFAGEQYEFLSTVILRDPNALPNTQNFASFVFDETAPARLKLSVTFGADFGDFNFRIDDNITTTDAYGTEILLLPRNFIDNYRLEFASVSTVRVGVGRCRDSTNSRSINSNSVLTADMTVSGAGGIQGGSSETADTWYEVHLIADLNGVNAIALLLTPSGVAISLPTGYEISRRVGIIRNDSSSNLIDFIQFGEGRQRRYHWILAFASKFVLTGGTATVATTVNLASLVPPTSTEAYLTFLNDGNRAASVAQIAADPSPSFVVVGAELVTRFPTSATQTISYFHPVGGGSRDFNIIVDGFYEDL